MDGVRLGSGARPYWNSGRSRRNLAAAANDRTRRDQFDDVDLDLRSGPKLAAISGALLAITSVFLPWFHAAGLDRAYTVVPVATPGLKGVAWLEVLLLLAGAALLATKGVPSLLGCIGALWFNLTMTIWIFGSKASTLVPDSVLPGGLAVGLGLGTDVALVGALLIMAGTVMTLVEQTWEGRSAIKLGWQIPAGVTIAVALIVAREAAWLHLDADRFGWDITIDAVPLLGEALLIMLVIGALIAIMVSLVSHPWLRVAGLAVGAIIAVISLVGVLAQDLSDNVARWVTDEASFLADHNVRLSRSAGPYYSLAAGTILASYSLALIVLRARAQSSPDGWSTGSQEQNVAPPIPPPFPF